jgi:hypothetical protein
MFALKLVLDRRCCHWLFPEGFEAPAGDARLIGFTMQTENAIAQADDWSQPIYIVTMAQCRGMRRARGSRDNASDCLFHRLERAGEAAKTPAAGFPRSPTTCASRKQAEKEMVPVDKCWWFYNCEARGALLKPKAGDRRVYCSYATMPFPPAREANGCRG